MPFFDSATVKPDSVQYGALNSHSPYPESQPATGAGHDGAVPDGPSLTSTAPAGPVSLIGCDAEPARWVTNAPRYVPVASWIVCPGWTDPSAACSCAAVDTLMVVPPPPPPSVVVLTWLLAGEVFPAASRARTVKLYVVEAASPLTVVLVPADVAATVLPVKIWYSVTPTLSVDAFQVSDTLDEVTPVLRRFPGAVGGDVSGPPPPPAHGRPSIVQLTGVPRPATLNPKSSLAPGAMSPLKPAFVNR
jgi:hypothetical protein